MKFAILLATAALAAVGVVASAQASPDSCSPTAYAPAAKFGQAAGQGASSGCHGDTYRYSLKLVDSQGNVLSAKSGVAFGDLAGATAPAPCAHKAVKSVASISVLGVTKTASSAFVNC